jgi:hypothetical protein
MKFIKPIPRIRFTVLLAFVSLFLSSSTKAQLSHPSTETYLRIINLLPILTPKIDIYRGSTPYLTGMKSGFFQNYLPVPSEGGNHFTVKQGDVVVGNFVIPLKGGDQFYTLAIFQNEGKPPAISFLDDAPPKKKPTPEEPSPTPQPRLRIYVGGYDFPIKISAKGVGEWVTQSTALITEKEINGQTPEVVQIDYTDKYGQKISLNFPTDYKSALCYSAFVTQRAIKRPRILAYADNLNPSDDPEGSPTPFPSPTP